MKLNWNVIKWFCLGMAAGNALHQHDWWSIAFFTGAIVSEIFDLRE